MNVHGQRRSVEGCDYIEEAVSQGYGRENVYPENISVDTDLFQKRRACTLNMIPKQLTGSQTMEEGYG